MGRTQVSGEEILDKTVESVDLADDLRSQIVENKTAGWHKTELEEVVRNVANKISIVSKHEKQKGFVSHKGFIKGCA